MLAAVEALSRLDGVANLLNKQVNGSLMPQTSALTGSLMTEYVYIFRHHLHNSSACYILVIIHAAPNY